VGNAACKIKIIITKRINSGREDSNWKVVDEWP
jgi:hypothetical protein